MLRWFSRLSRRTTTTARSRTRQSLELLSRMVRIQSLATSATSGFRSTHRRGQSLTRRLNSESLEDRRMLAIITVDSLADNTIDDGIITLREAIIAANADAIADATEGVQMGAGNDIINFAAALDGMTITLVAGALDTVIEGLTIDASALPSGMTIDASGSDPTAAAGDGIRIFNFDDGNDDVDLDMAVSGLTLIEGDVTGFGGAIRSHENLTINGSIVSGNSATLDGGGISLMSASLATITNSLVTGNFTVADGGGIYANNTPTINITGSTFGDNLANDKGGGIYIQNSTAVSISASTVSGNSVVDDGGGLYLVNITTATITNSTISSNHADVDGGGIWIDVNGGQWLTILHSTITANWSDSDNSATGSGGGLFAGAGAGTVTLENTIIADNLDFNGIAPDIDNMTAGVATLNTPFTLVGNNLGSGLAASALIGTNAVPIDPMLTPLSNKGGPSETHALLVGSPALGAGDPAFAAPPAFDQRGAPFLRDAGTQLDIGAYERQTIAVLNLVVDTLLDENDGDYSAGDLSLREAVGLANGSIGPNTITFAAALDGGTIPLNLLLDEIDITDEVIIDATSLPAGITVDAGDGADGAFNTADGIRIFNINDSQANDIDVEMKGITFTGGDVDDGGGAIRSIENLTLTDSTVTGNSATGNGGAIYADNATQFTLSDSIVFGNTTATDGGGLALYNLSNASILRSTISGNNAGNDTGDHGGGVYLFDVNNLSVVDTTISGNFAGGDGGSVYLYQADSSTISNSTISGNRANGSGGGIHVILGEVDTLTVEHSTVTGNFANDDSDGTGSGGGVFLEDNNVDVNGIVKLDHTIVALNTDESGTAPDIDNTTDPGTTLNNTLSLVGNNLGSGLAVGALVGTNAAPIDPLLGALSNNGGPTFTHALLSSSPAIDAGSGGFTPPPTNDQRGLGFPRVIDGNNNGTATIDIGAFEFLPFIDNQGPRVTNVIIPDFPDYDLFDPKPSEDGPTPAVNSLSIGIEDLPPRPLGTIDPALVGATQVDEFEPNNTIATAQPLDNFFSLAPSANIGDATQNTATTIPHATVVATGDGTFDYFSFEVAAAGDRGIFDIDFGQDSGGSIDTEIFLYDSAGTLLAENDDPTSSAVGAGGSTSTFDSFLEFSFTAPGTYIIAVGEFNTIGNAGGVADNPPDAGDTYTLQVSIERHVLPLNPGFFRLVGDANGFIPIRSVSFVPDPLVIGAPATGNIVLDFFEPLPDDRFTLTLNDDIHDPSGNMLDGETNTIEPQEIPIFPSGDGIPGGDFVARFTVDTRAEIGVWGTGTVIVDTNGNLFYDPENADFTNRDITYHLGFSSEYVFGGNFSGPGPDGDYGTPDDTTAPAGNAVADGFDKLGAYGRFDAGLRWIFDTNNDGVVDQLVPEDFILGLPVAGNFDGNDVNGDEVGLFTGTTWYFDTNHDFVVDTSFPATYMGAPYIGYPIAGDFDGDGDDDVATYVAAPNLGTGNRFFVDLNNAAAGSPIVINGADHSFGVGVGVSFFGFPGVRERPVAGDMNGDGIDDFGLWVPDGTTLVPGDQGQWFFLVSGYDIPTSAAVETTVLDRIQGGFVAYTPTPFSNDFHAHFGNSFSLPVVGNFDPPTTPGFPFVISTATSSSSQSSTTASSSTTKVDTSQEPVAKATSTKTTSGEASVEERQKTSVLASIAKASDNTQDKTVTGSQSTTEERNPQRDIQPPKEDPVTIEVIENKTTSAATETSIREEIAATKTEAIASPVEEKRAGTIAITPIVVSEDKAAPIAKATRRVGGFTLGSKTTAPVQRIEPPAAPVSPVKKTPVLVANTVVVAKASSQVKSPEKHVEQKPTTDEKSKANPVILPLLSSAQSKATTRYYITADVPEAARDFTRQEIKEIDAAFAAAARGDLEGVNSDNLAKDRARDEATTELTAKQRAFGVGSANWN